MKSTRNLGKRAVVVALAFYLSVLIAPGHAQQASPTPTKLQETVEDGQVTQSFLREQRVFDICEPEEINRPVPVPPDVLQFFRKKTHINDCFDNSEGCPRRNPGAWFAVSEIHLHDPDEKDLIVMPKGCWICFNGAHTCSVWIFRQTPKGHQLVLYMDGQNQVRVLTSSSHGYHDLLVQGDSGVWDFYDRLFKFDGRRYRETREWYGHNSEKASLRDLNRLMHLSPNDAVLYNQRGDAYDDLHQYQRAIEDYDQAIRLDPGNVEAYSCGSYYYQSYRKFRHGVEDYEPPVIRLSPCLHSPYFNRGNVYYFALKQYQRAIDDYDQAIHFAPEDAIAYYNRAELYHLLKQDDHAIQDYTQAIRLDFLDEELAYYARGLAYQELKQYDAALLDYNKVVSLCPKCSRAYAARGETYDALKQYQHALQDYNRAIRLKHNADFYNGRGKVYRDLNQLQRAIRNFSDAIRLNPKNADAYYNRGLAYQELNQDDRAQQDFDRAKRLQESGSTLP
jgi:tetratricopeptide (TPR) repeat protein